MQLFYFFVSRRWYRGNTGRGVLTVCLRVCVRIACKCFYGEGLCDSSHPAAASHPLPWRSNSVGDGVYWTESVRCFFFFLSRQSSLVLFPYPPPSSVPPHNALIIHAISAKRYVAAGPWSCPRDVNNHSCLKEKRTQETRQSADHSTHRSRRPSEPGKYVRDPDVWRGRRTFLCHTQWPRDPGSDVRDSPLGPVGFPLGVVHSGRVKRPPWVPVKRHYPVKYAI